MLRHTTALNNRTPAAVYDSGYRNRHAVVQTADNEVLPGGTAYISDVGMTGPFDSVIGIKKDIVIEKFLTQMPNKFDVAKNDVRLQGVILDVDAESGRARSIERISLKLKE